MSSDDLYTWTIAIVTGTLVTIAAFFAIPQLKIKTIDDEPAVVQIDFMQWREPAPLPKPSTPKPPVPKKQDPVKPMETPPKIKSEPPKAPPPKPPERQVIPEKQLPLNQPTPPKAQPEPAPQPEPVPVTQPEADTQPAPLPRPIPIFQLTSMPRFARYVEPEYPAIMRSLGQDASVKVEVLIDSKGQPRKVTILKSGGEEFDNAVIAALMQSTFIPGNVEGKPVAVLWRTQIKFRLK
jgi:TonB family protein